MATETPMATEQLGRRAVRRWHRQRRRHAMAAINARGLGRIVSRERPTDTFTAPGDRVGEAQTTWWLGLLARLDAGLDDDLAAMDPAARYAAVCDAWAAQVREAPSYPTGAGDARRDAAARRHARLLALFAGRAGVADDHEVAADAGLALVRELSASA